MTDVRFAAVYAYMLMAVYLCDMWGLLLYLLTCLWQSICVTDVRFAAVYAYMLTAVYLCDGCEAWCYIYKQAIVSRALMFSL